MAAVSWQLWAQGIYYYNLIRWILKPSYIYIKVEEQIKLKLVFNCSLTLFNVSNLI